MLIYIYVFYNIYNIKIICLYHILNLELRRDNMKEFALINSPIFWEATYDNEDYLPPLGLGYIATYLKRSNVDVTLVDSVYERLGVNDIITLINNHSYDYIGINVFSQNYDLVKYIVERINRKCICFIGGQVVKYLYMDIINWKSKANIIAIIGDGELIIPAIVQNTCQQKPVAIQNGNMVYTVNAVSPYFPINISEIKLDRRVFKNDIYTNHYGDLEASIITSRGCLYNCAFCGGARCLNKDIPIRLKSKNSIIAEIRGLLELSPDLKSIRILDDLFLKNSSSIDQAYEIFSTFPVLSWRGMVHVLSLYHSLEKVHELSQSNCKELFLGIESGSNKIRQKINKLGTPEQIIEVAKSVLQIGIDIKGYFIFGFPHEKQGDFEDTYHLAQELKNISEKTTGSFRTSVFQFRPYHGTQLYNEIVSEFGTIGCMHQNERIKSFDRRNQFNFFTDNYSDESDDVLAEYINKTQMLTED